MESTNWQKRAIFNKNEGKIKKNVGKSKRLLKKRSRMEKVRGFLVLLKRGLPRRKDSVAGRARIFCQKGTNAGPFADMKGPGFIGGAVINL